MTKPAGISLDASRQGSQPWCNEVQGGGGHGVDLKGRSGGVSDDRGNGGVGKARAARQVEVARMAEAVLAVKMQAVATVWGDVGVDDACRAVQIGEGKRMFMSCSHSS